MNTATKAKWNTFEVTMAQILRLWALLSATYLHYTCNAVMFDLRLSSKSVCELEVVKTTVELDCGHQNTEIAMAWVGVFPTYVLPDDILRHSLTRDFMSYAVVYAVQVNCESHLWHFHI